MVDRAVSKRAVEEFGYCYILNPHFDENAGGNIQKYRPTRHEWISNPRSFIQGHAGSSLAWFYLRR